MINPLPDSKIFKFANKQELQQYSKRINCRPNDPHNYFKRAEIFFNLHDFKHCIKDCDKVLSFNSTHMGAILLKAKALFSMGNVLECKNSYNTAIQLASDDLNLKAELFIVESVINLVELLETPSHCKKDDDMISCLEKAITMCPESAFLKLRRIEYMIYIGQIEQALQLCDVLEGHTKDPDLTLLKAKALKYQGEKERAVETLTNAVQTFNENEGLAKMLSAIAEQENLKQKADFALKNQQYEQACQFYTEALVIDPGDRKFNAILYEKRADANRIMNNVHCALLDYTKAIKLDPQCKSAYLKKSNLYAEMKNYEKALIDLKTLKGLGTHCAIFEKNLQELQNKSQTKGSKDYYKILGIQKDADAKEIRKAYKKLALQWHPDHHSEDMEFAEETIKDINEAKDVLTVPNKKMKYDYEGNTNVNFTIYATTASGAANPFYYPAAFATAFKFARTTNFGAQFMTQTS